MQPRDEQVHALESRLAKVSEEACKDRDKREEAESSAQTSKELYESRKKEISDLQMELESVRAALKKTTDELEGRVKEKEQKLCEKEFQICNMEVGSEQWVWGGCICSCLFSMLRCWDVGQMGVHALLGVPCGCCLYRAVERACCFS